MTKLMKLMKLQAFMFTGSVVSFSVVQPGSKSIYSNRRNLYDGFELGVIVGLVWPILIPLVIQKNIRDTVNADPVQDTERNSSNSQSGSSPR